MFAENNKISGRQIFRLLTYDLLGMGTLLLPQILGKHAGRDGILSIGIALAAGWLFLGIIKTVLTDITGTYADYLRKQFKGWAATVVLVFYVVWFCLLAGYTACIFSELVITHLVEGVSFFFVLTVILLLCFYGMMGGIEGRARVYELLFWFLLVPFFIMLLSSLREVDADYWSPVFYRPAGKILEGSLSICFFESVLFLTLFLKEYAAEKNVVYKNAKRAFLLFILIFAALYLILEGMFGSSMLASMDYAVVTMMSNVQIGGGFLKRTDTLMFGIWFFTLYALLNSLIFYMGNIVTRVWRMKKFFLYAGVTAAVYMTAVWFYRSDAAGEKMESILWKYGLLFSAGVPVILWLKIKWRDQRNRKIGKRMMMAAALSGMLFLQGCKNAELEDREFPVLLAIRGEGEFERQWLEYEQSGSKKIDYHHLKAVLIERSFLEDEKSMERMLALLEKDTRIPWNAYVFVTDRCETMLAAEEKLPVPLGEYLEQMTENTSPVKPEKVPTIGKLYKERKNRQETLFLPYVEMLDGAPVVTACEVWKRGSAKGLFDTDTAYASYLIQNAMDTDTLQLAGQYFVKITHPVCRIKLCKRQKTDGRTGRYVKVSVGGEGMLLNDSVGSGDMTTDEMLDRKVREYLQRTAEEALSQEVDVTNSFKKIGAQQRDWYGIYENAPLQYEKDITIQFEVKIHWKKE